MKKLLIAIAILCISVNVFADRITDNYNLVIWDEGSRNWHSKISNDIISIDTVMGIISADSVDGNMITIISSDVGTLKTTQTIISSDVGTLKNVQLIVDGIAYARTDVGIEAAIADLGSDGVIYLTEGTYTLAGDIDFANTNDNILMQGAGMLTTILELDDGVDENVITVGSASGITLRDFQVDGNKDNQSDGKGISATTNSNNLKITDIYIKDVYDTGIQVQKGSDNLLIKNCRLENIGSASSDMGIRVFGSDFVIIESNFLDTIADDGIQLLNSTTSYPENFIISSNIVRDAGEEAEGSCISVIEGKDGVISGNVCELTNPSNNVNFIFVQGPGGNTYANTTITGNTGINISGAGIELQDGGCTVTGNIISKDGVTDSQGIAVIGDAHDSIIVGNFVNNAGGHGMKINTPVENVTVSNNIIKNSQKATSGSAIRLFGNIGETARNVIITNNQLYDDQAIATQTYGISAGSDGSWEDVRIFGNYFNGNITANVNNVPTSTVSSDSVLWPKSLRISADTTATVGGSVGRIEILSADGVKCYIPIYASS